VEVAVAFTDTVVDAIVATGEIEAMQQIMLRPEAEGRVIELLFREGARVAAGTPLIQIDAAELTAQVERARADRDLAKQGLSRTQQLLTERAAATADLERAEATSRVAQASLDLLELRLARTTVRAPFAGVIGQRRVSLGDYVTPQTELLSLQTVSPQRVSFTVPERYASALKAGQDVTFQVAALPGRTFTARVDFVDPVVTLPARAIAVKAIADNREGILQAGMFIEARLATEVRSGATVIPEEAVSPAAGASYAWVIVDGKAVRREIELGVRTPGFVEVRSGIVTGESVVVGGLDRLFDGASVNATVVERTPREAREG
jgi:membrane fusion protein (multidrug efflux system)